MNSVRTPWLIADEECWFGIWNKKYYLCCYDTNALFGCAGKKRIRVTAHKTKPLEKSKRVYVRRRYNYFWCWHRTKIDLVILTDPIRYLYIGIDKLLDKLLVDKDKPDNLVPPTAIWLTIETRD